jgi:hypothetical protein
MKVVKM